VCSLAGGGECVNCRWPGLSASLSLDPDSAETIVQEKGNVVARDIAGLWDIIQTNNFVVPINIDPVKPDGSFTLHAEQGQGEVSGPGEGHVNGNLVNFLVNWTNGTTGAYNGAFDEHGVINGSTFDIKHPGAFAGWHSSRGF
jgi:hypothetical protein